MIAVLERLIGQPDVAVLANGTYPTNPLALHYLHTLPVVCCDGAANRFVAEGGVPIAIVGDGDSLDPRLREHLSSRMCCMAEQETNDLTKALCWSVANGYARPLILGAAGQREDHTLGNIALLAHHTQQGITTAGLLTEHGLFVACCGTQRFDMPIGTRVSVFNFGAKRLASIGLEYPLYNLNALWQGTLNRTIATPFSIMADGVYLLYVVLEEV